MHDLVLLLAVSLIVFVLTIASRVGRTKKRQVKRFTAESFQTDGWSFKQPDDAETRDHWVIR